MVAKRSSGKEAAMLRRPLLPDHRSLTLEEVALIADGIRSLAGRPYRTAHGAKTGKIETQKGKNYNLNNALAAE